MQAGVAVGMRISAVSDPMRPGVMWELKDRPSLRFVLDTLRMQRSNPVDINFEPLMSGEGVLCMHADVVTPGHPHSDVKA